MQRYSVKATYEDWKWLMSLLYSVVGQGAESKWGSNPALVVIYNLINELLEVWTIKFYKRQENYSAQLKQSERMLFKAALDTVPNDAGHDTAMRETWLAKLKLHPLGLTEKDFKKGISKRRK